MLDDEHGDNVPDPSTVRIFMALMTIDFVPRIVATGRFGSPDQNNVKRMKEATCQSTFKPRIN